MVRLTTRPDLMQRAHEWLAVMGLDPALQSEVAAEFAAVEREAIERAAAAALPFDSDAWRAIRALAAPDRHCDCEQSAAGATPSGLT